MTYLLTTPLKMARDVAFLLMLCFATFNAPALMQTQNSSDDCGIGFFNPPFGIYFYIETGCN